MADVTDYMHVSMSGVDPVVAVSTMNELRDDISFGYRDNNGAPVSLLTEDDIQVKRIRSEDDMSVLYTAPGQGVWPNQQQELTLSDNVSSQLNGIVVEWSGYDPATGKALNGDWNYTHIPKAALGRNGVRCPLFAGNTPVQKWLVVSDRSVTGVASNANAPKNQLVIRRIFGY